MIVRDARRAEHDLGPCRPHVIRRLVSGSLPKPLAETDDRRLAWREAQQRHRARFGRQHSARELACEACGSPTVETPKGHGKRYCSAACRQRAYIARRAA